jgi:processive 1,2-diacylglycerol beta-glucosyltransferase
VDALSHAPGWFRRAYPSTYLALVRVFPALWHAGYRLLDQDACAPVLAPLRRTWNRLVMRRFAAWLQAQRADIVVVTHFLAADVCGSVRAKSPMRCVVVVTDLYAHRFWLTAEADATVVATQEAAAALRRRGMPDARVHVIGIPVGAGFSQPSDRAALQQRHGLDPAKLTVLVASGGTTIGRFVEAVERVAELESAYPNRLQMLVVCGENEQARQQLSQSAGRWTMPVRVFGFVNDMPDLMGVSDVLVGKAGGLTMSEAIVKQLPMIFYHVIPGQEQMNANDAVARGFARLGRGPAGAAAALAALLDAPDELRRMRDALKAAARPAAAMAIVEQVIKPLMDGAQ